MAKHEDIDHTGVTGVPAAEVFDETAHDLHDHTGITGVGGGGSSFVGVKAYHSTTQSIPDNTLTPLIFDTEDYDTDTLHDTVTNSSRITVNQTGVWRFSFHVFWDIASATGIRVAKLRVDGTTDVVGSDHRAVGSTAVNVTNIHTVDVELTSGQYVEAIAFQNRGGAAALNSGSATAANANTFSAHFLGAV